jgi:hypothetical protein
MTAELSPSAIRRVPTLASQVLPVSFVPPHHMPAAEGEGLLLVGVADKVMVADTTTIVSSTGAVPGSASE